MANDKDELGIMEDFEWALKDPTEEKLREVGEVVSVVTMKLAAAISDLQTAVTEIQTKLGGIDSRVSQLDSKIAGIRTAGPSAGGEAGPAAAASAGPRGKAQAPAAAPAPAPGGGGTLMGELKSLLSARRRKDTPGPGETG